MTCVYLHSNHTQYLQADYRLWAGLCLKSLETFLSFLKLNWKRLIFLLKTFPPSLELIKVWAVGLSAPIWAGWDKLYKSIAYHIHNLLEWQAKLKLNSLRLIGHRSLQFLIECHQVIEELPLSMSPTNQGVWNTMEALMSLFFPGWNNLLRSK